MTFDIHIQPVPADEVIGYKVITFGFAAALKVKGGYALVDRWMKTLMTPKGTDPLYPEEGTLFGSLIGANITSSADLHDVVALAVDDANNQVELQDEAGNYPDNESLQSAIIEQFVDHPDGFEVWVIITNQAGESLRLNLPLLATR